MRLVGYVRASTDEQELSPEVQATRLRAWARAQQVELTQVVIDAGVSGTVHPLKRSGFSSVVELLRSDSADGVVALRLDRYARRARYIDEVSDMFDQRGWQFIVSDMTLDRTTASGAYVQRIMADTAQYERDQIAERTKQALAQIRKQGRAFSRFTPFGWRTAEGKAEVQRGDKRPLIEHAEELAALQRISALRVEGFGPRRIARKLTTERIRNPRTGEWWRRRAVERALATLERS
jgi:site-specific DNA recombinase